jgi:hypothetical protein
MNAITTIREIDHGVRNHASVGGTAILTHGAALLLGATFPNRTFTATATGATESDTSPRAAQPNSTPARQLTLDNGMALEYDDLLIATGLQPCASVPGADGAASTA